MRTPAQAPELIIFDCDGVLIDSEILVCRIAAEELTRLGYKVSVEQVVDRFAGRPDHEMQAEIEQDWGRPLPPEYKERVNARTAEAYGSDLTIMPRLLEALDAIHLPTCVASSSYPDKLRLGLQTVGLYNRFAPNIISASMLARGKPEPDIFIYAAGWMHKAPARSIVVEDSVPGVRSACRAGMRVLGFDGGQHSTPNLRRRLLEAGAEVVFSDMQQLPSLLA